MEILTKSMVAHAWVEASRDGVTDSERRDMDVMERDLARQTRFREQYLGHNRAAAIHGAKVLLPSAAVVGGIIGGLAELAPNNSWARARTGFIGGALLAGVMAAMLGGAAWMGSAAWSEHVVNRSIEDALDYAELAHVLVDQGVTPDPILLGMAP